MRKAPTAPVAPRPLVGVSCCQREINGGIFHTVLEKYLLAVTDISECQVLLIPALGAQDRGGRLDLAALLDRLDGVLLTGARSMVAPHLYGGEADPAGVAHDDARDATTLALARDAVARGVPLLGICRGLQEVCCAFGGALEPDLAARDDRLDHRARPSVGYEERYLPTHDIVCLPGGALAPIVRAAGAADRFAVNSLHVQGLDRLSPRLRAEAVADDGLVEAISVRHAKTFALAVQWHPEWHLDSHAVNRRLFETFGEACRARYRARAGAAGPSDPKAGRRSTVRGPGAP